MNDYERAISYFVIAYILGAVITFGHAVNRPCDPTLSITRCQADATAIGLCGAMFWPFYVSAQVWKP